MDVSKRILPLARLPTCPRTVCEVAVPTAPVFVVPPIYVIVLTVWVSPYFRVIVEVSEVNVIASLTVKTETVEVS